MFTTVWFLEGIKRLIPLILSLTVHEWAHAYAAFRLGDDTAARQGRLTLNPIAHIDPIGTLLVPFLRLPFGFGWAKPVQFNALRFRRDVTMLTGTMIVAVAGPLSNLVLAVLCAVVYGLLHRFGVSSGALYDLVGQGIFMNIALCVFNFLPVPPLDGSRVVDGLLPYRLRPQWEQLQQYSWILFLGLIYFGGSIIQVPVQWLARPLLGLAVLVAGQG